MSSPAVHVLRIAPAPPSAGEERLRALDVPVVRWILPDDTPELSAEPPAGVYWAKFDTAGGEQSQASESAHRLLRWIEGAGRRVVNGSGASALRGHRGDRLRALTDAGLNTPRFIEVTRREELADAARSLRTPLLLRAEQGAQQFRIEGHGELSYLAQDRSLPRTGHWLLEELLPAGRARAVRFGFVGGRLETMDRAKHTALFDDRRELRPLRGDEQAQLARTPLAARLARFLEERRIDIAAAEVAALPGLEPFVYELEINPVCHGPAGVASETATERIVSFLSGLLDFSRSERSRS